MRAKIIGTGSYVPKRIVTNADLEQTVETTDRWIVERTGIRERRIVAGDEATSDLAYHAAVAALASSGIEADAIDLIIVATATPDMLFPSTACLVQDRLKATGAAAFDLSAACSGFLYALAVGEQFIRSGSHRHVLVIGAEVMSGIVDWKDRSTCILFGDGAGAVVLGGSRGRRGILSSHLHSDGRLSDLIAVPGGGSADLTATPGGGSAFPPSGQIVLENRKTIRMKGNETFKAAVRALEEVAREGLAANGMEIGDVNWIVPHQANIRIIRAVAERLNFPIDRVIVNLDRYGNTSAASIPLALDEAVRSGRISPNNILLMLAFGGGLTLAASIVRW